jgi:hypothetical protein
VWVRFYESYDFGGCWEPPSSDIAYPEASLRGFVSLNAAVCATQFDTLARRQREIDNECHACYGAGVVGFTAEEETKCDKCGGLGFRALPPFPEATPVPVMEEAKPYRDSDGKDHDAVRCDAMIDADCDNKLPGEKATCCVCIGHDCAEARAERAKHPALLD